jgi:ribonuclease HI
MWKLYSDGGCRPNPGNGSYGAALYKDETLIESIGGHIGDTTNNKAEYMGFYKGLQLVHEHCDSDDTIDIYLDSSLVLKQMTGEWKVKDDSLKDINKKCKHLSKSFSLNYNWVKGHSGDPKNEYVDSTCTFFIGLSNQKSTSVPEKDDSRVHLNCPFSDKDEAKSLGAKWDVNVKKWWIPSNMTELFEKWL